MYSERLIPVLLRHFRTSVGLAAILGVLACTSQQNVNVNTGTENGTNLRNSNEQTLSPTVAAGFGPGATAEANGSSGSTGSGLRHPSGSTSESATTSPEENSRTPSPGKFVFSETFATVGEGQIPNDWTTDDGLGVVTQGRSKCLGMLKKGEHKLVTPEITWPSNFRIEVDTQIYKIEWTDQYVELGASGIQAVFGSGYDSRDAKLTNASDLARAFERYIGQRVTLALEKRGTVLRTSVDGNPIMLSRKSDMTAWGNAPLTIKFRAANGVCLYRISVRRLPD
jgi:hypothetical protein